MKKFSSILICMLLLLGAYGQLSAQINISDLHITLKKDVAEISSIDSAITNIQGIHKEEMAAIAKECNQLRLLLYSCEENCMFDQTYLLHQAISMYERLEKLSHPNNAALADAKRLVTRYQLLLETLRRLPPDLSEIEEVPDSLREISSDSLLYQLTTFIPFGHYSMSPEEQLVRDSCITNVRELLHFCQHTTSIYEEQTHQYARLCEEFSSTYHYAEERFHVLHNKIFQGTDYSFIDILRAPLLYFSAVRKECHKRYSNAPSIYTAKEIIIVFLDMFGALLLAIAIVWLLCYITRNYPNRLYRLKQNKAIYTNAIYMGLLLVCLYIDVRICHFPLITINQMVFLVYFLYVLMLQISILIREKGDRAAAGMKLYVPSIFCGFFLIFLRMFFVPDSVLILLIAIITTVCFLWQIVVLLRHWVKASAFDNIIASITTLVFSVAMVDAWIGYTFLGMQIIFWWEAQQVAIVIVAGAYQIINLYIKGPLKRRIDRYTDKRGKHKVGQATSTIQLTWFTDMLIKVVIPVAGIISMPLCIYLALRFFNAQNQYLEFLHRTLFSLGNKEDLVFDVSVYNLLIIISLYFIFNYLRYLAISIFGQARVRIEQNRSGRQEIHTNQMNISLGVNIISMVTWVIYVAVSFIILHIPMQTLALLFTGLLTGIGFAMHDVLNNIIYGMQLMAGRLRVGDYVICDNYRGEITSISYQTTQMLTEENALVSFTNADLFSKNFQNLTRQNPYEVNRVACNIAYGSDIALAEKLIREAIESLDGTDDYGRPLLSRQEGIRIEMRDLGTNGIQMAVRFGIIAEKRTWFLPILRKQIYTYLSDGGIKIPFQQMDLHLINESNEK